MKVRTAMIGKRKENEPTKILAHLRSPTAEEEEGEEIA